ncbi:MAG: RDD family protein [Candidatus Acidiferrales bacterium]
MIRICSQCGALSLEDVEKCSFCDFPFVEDRIISEPVAVGASAAAEEPEWRREVSRRLEQYRARRGRLHPGEYQSGLPFSTELDLEEDEVRERPRQRPATRQRQAERMEICIQPELDFSTALHDRAHPQTALVPVADLAERRSAGMLDALFLALTAAGFLGLFRSLGGQIIFEKVDAIVYLTAFYLFYAQYFFLFTTFAGATPGMQLRGLTIVRLDGTLPDTRQLLWRSFGYLLSGATLMLGYLWALWDEDHFTWQDRISQTYITAAAPLADSDSFDVRAAHHTFAHK